MKPLKVSDFSDLITKSVFCKCMKYKRFLISLFGMQLVTLNIGKKTFKANPLFMIKGNIMDLILFIHKDGSKKGEILKKAIEQKVDGVKFQTFHTIDALKTRLKQFSKHNDKELFILLADIRERLYELTPLIDLLEDKRLILIIPDKSQVTISKSLRFFPRFFTPLSNTYEDLCDVLNKMIGPKQKHKSVKRDMNCVKKVSYS